MQLIVRLVMLWLETSMLGKMSVADENIILYFENRPVKNIEFCFENRPVNEPDMAGALCSATFFRRSGQNEFRS